MYVLILNSTDLYFIALCISHASPPLMASWFLKKPCLMMNSPINRYMKMLIRVFHEYMSLCSLL